MVAQDTKSLTAEETSLGMITKNGLPGEARDPVFSLTVGANSKPIKTSFGWHVFHVTKIEPGSTKSLDEVRERLRNDIALQRAGDALFDIANNIEDEFAGGASVTEAANRFNIVVKRIDVVDAAGRDANGDQIADLPKMRNFLRVVFETQAGEEPALQEDETGSYFAVRVEHIVPPALRPFETIRTKVRAAWQEDTRRESVRKTAEEIAEKIRLGAATGTFGGTNGVSFKKTEPLTRDRLGTDYDVSAELLAGLFAILPGEVTVAETPTRDGYVVAKLQKIQPADPSTSGDLRRALDQALGRSLLNDIVAAYRTALTAEYGVEINQSAIEAMF